MLKGKSPAVVAENVREMKRKGLSERDATLVSLKRSKQESEDDGPKLGSTKSHDSYPYGTEMHLEHATLKKLGVSKLPAIGKNLRLHVKAKVTRVSDSADEGGSNRSVHLQVTHMSRMGDDSGDE